MNALHVVGGSAAGSTIWKRSALAECPTGEINLLHNHFLTDEITCNGRDIVAIGLSIGIGQGRLRVGQFGGAVRYPQVL